MAKELKTRVLNDVIRDYTENIDMTKPYTLQPSKTGGFLGCCCQAEVPKVYLE